MPARKSSSTSLRRMRWDQAVILLNGELKHPEAIHRLVQSGATLLCTDGGVRHAKQLGLEPRIVIGDMDSLPKRLPKWKNAIYLCNFHEDQSDFEKALQFCAQRRLHTVWVAGALGGRLDHTLVNLALIERFSQHFRIAFADERAWIMTPGRHRVPCNAGQTVTLLPATTIARISARGLKFPLHRFQLSRSSRGLSNQATSREIAIQVHSGRVWVVLP